MLLNEAFCVVMSVYCGAIMAFTRTLTVNVITEPQMPILKPFLDTRSMALRSILANTDRQHINYRREPCCLLSGELYSQL